MIARTLPTAEKRTALFMTMVHVGAAATLLLIATLLTELPDFIGGLPQGMLLVSVAVIFRRKLRDEYVEVLWRTGATAAFAAVVCGFLVAPLVVGAFGVGAKSLTDPRDFLIVAQGPAAVALAGFYLGFYWRMLLGGPGR